MPYIVTVSQESPDSDENTLVMDELSRTAVATLEEARDYVHSLGADYGAMAHLDCVLDGTSRMPIGPLPDGTVIEVRWRDHAVMCPQAPHRTDRSGACTCPELIADADRKTLEFARSTPLWSKRAAGINFKA